MPLYCAAFNCCSTYKKELNLKFHRFPKDEQLKQKWVVALKRSDYNPSKTAVICSEHFTEEDYYVNPYGTKVLKKSATPSIFNFNGSSSGKSRKKRLMTEDIPSVEQESTPPVLESSQTSSTTAITPIVPTETFEGRHTPSVEQESSSPVLESSETSSTTEIITIITDETFEGGHNVEQEISTPSTSQIDFTLIRRRKRSVPAFIGDYEESDLEDPFKRHKYWTDSQSKIAEYRKKNKYLSCKLQRKNKRIADLSAMLEDIRQQNLMTSQSSLVFKESFPGTEQDPLSRQLERRCRSFSPEFRSFAMTLYSLSSSAYNYVREYFGKNSLPHPRTLTKWCTSVANSAGYAAEALGATEIKTEMGNGDEQNDNQETC